MTWSTIYVFRNVSSMFGKEHGLIIGTDPNIEVKVGEPQKLESRDLLSMGFCLPCSHTLVCWDLEAKSYTGLPMTPTPAPNHALGTTTVSILRFQESTQLRGGWL